MMMNRQKQRHALAAAALALAACTAAAQAPVASAAHRAAAAGYEAFERRDYAAAVEHAQRALRRAPERRDWWLLLAQALAASQRFDEAGQALERAERARGDDAALRRVRADLQRARAQAAGAAMYQALQAQDLDSAIRHGRAAVQAAPEDPAFRLVLVQALLRQGQFAEAERMAGETIALLPDSAVPLALRGYARQALGQPAEAAADLQRALQQRGLAPAAQRELRLLAADLALARGDTAAAQEVLAGLPGQDAAAQARREQALARAAGLAVPYALQPPAIDCSAVASSNTCELLAAGAPPAPGFASATAAYQAMERRDYAGALAQARIATAAAPGRRDWQLLHMNAALAAGEPAEAERAASAALALGAGPELLAQRASIRRGLGNLAGAEEDAQAALAAGTLPATTEAGLLADLGRKEEARARLAAAPPVARTPAQQLDLAYLSSRIGDSAAARAAFVAADAGGALPVTSLLDAGYASVREHQDMEAVSFFRRAIDAQIGMQLKLEPQMVYDTRRMVAEVSRRWGVLASLTSRNGGGAAPGFGVVGGPSTQRVLQAGVEGYLRPWGFRNGRFVELFARGFATLDNEGIGPTGGDSFQGGIGARWKPLTAHNLVLSGSRIFGPEVADDWLLQAAYSLDYGTDLRVDTASWWTTRAFAEVGRYLEASEHYGLATLMVGRSFVASEDGRTVLFPHGVLAAEYSSTAAERTSVGVGPGLSVRRWFREDAYNAPRSYWDLTVQYRARVAGDDRTDGLYLNTLVSY